MLIFASIFGMGRFCRHHNFLPPLSLYRPCTATAVAVVVNAVALRCNLTQGTFINVLDSFWSVIFIFITRTLQGDLRASALPWLLHTAILFSWPRKDEKSLWKALDTFGKKINVPWKKMMDWVWLLTLLFTKNNYQELPLGGKGELDG